MAETIYEYIKELESDLEYLQKEKAYLEDFITFKSLTDEYVYFRQNAYEECPEDCPFPYYIL